MCYSLSLSRDGWLLFATRFIRLFSYGFLSVGLILYLSQLGFDQFSIGILFTGTLLGDLVITFMLTTMADSLGRKSVLITGAVLKLGAGLAFGFVSNFWVLLIAGTLGVISPTGGEIGPFLAVEQAALTEALKTGDEIASIFGWYNLLGYLSQALGALSAGATISIAMHTLAFNALSAYRLILIGYSISAILMILCYVTLSNDVEPLHARDVAAPRNWFGKFGLHHPESRTIVSKLSALFIIDAFAGGFVMQTMIVYWFETRYQVDPVVLGSLMMGANVLAGISALAATPLVKTIGPIHTMVFTHLPSNIFLLLVPLMPNLSWAMVMLLIRFSISQMDVPARQAYVAVVVAPDERSAAGGITNIVRSIGVALSPLAAGHLLKDPNSMLFSMPFIISGILKIVYDLLLWFSFKSAESHTSMGVLPTRAEYAPVATQEQDQKPILTSGVVDLDETEDGDMEAHHSPVATKESAGGDHGGPVVPHQQKHKKKDKKKVDKTGTIN